MSMLLMEFQLCREVQLLKYQQVVGATAVRQVFVRRAALTLAQPEVAASVGLAAGD
jgi:hypothetical protein